MKHNFYFKHSKGSALITVVAVAAIVMSMIALSTAKISQAGLGSLNSSKIALQAQQYAAAEASILQATNYDGLTAHDRQNIRNTDYFSEVVLSEESDYDEDIKQRTAVISIYRGNEVLPRYSLETLLLSTNKDTGVPVGTVIAWPVNSLPQESGVWLECNGQSCAAYPKLVAVLGHATVPDYRGVFLRAYGSRTSSHYGSVTHQSGAMGELQGDAIRNITGSYTGYEFGATDGGWQFDGALYATNDSGYRGNENSEDRAIRLRLDASRTVPTASENRPINIAVKYLIKAE